MYCLFVFCLFVCFLPVCFKYLNNQNKHCLFYLFALTIIAVKEETSRVCSATLEFDYRFGWVRVGVGLDWVEVGLGLG